MPANSYPKSRNPLHNRPPLFQLSRADRQVGHLVGNIVQTCTKQSGEANQRTVRIISSRRFARSDYPAHAGHLSNQLSKFSLAFHEDRFGAAIAKDRDISDKLNDISKSP